jgi:thymidine kinase
MSLELYIGPMFAGKSSSIITILRRNRFIQRPTLCITNSMDKRYTMESKVVSHDRDSYAAIAVSTLLPLLESQEFHQAKCIIIDEAQFFTDLKDFVVTAVDTYEKDIICVGLDGDSERNPFGQIIDLVPYADNIRKFKAYCTQCADGTHGIFSYRRAWAPQTQISVGNEDQYEALCRKHYLAARKLDLPRK